MLTAGSYLTPILLGGKNSMWFTEQIYDQFITRYNWESGATFGVLLLVFTSAVVVARPAAQRPDLGRHCGEELAAWPGARPTTNLAAGSTAVMS